MATSGTITIAQLEIVDVIESAYRRIKIPVQLITSEKLDFASKLLWSMLQAWANEGHPVWKISTQYLPLYPGVEAVSAETGSIEFLNQNLVTPQRLTGTYVSSAGGTPENAFNQDLLNAFTQVSANGQLDIDLGAQVLVDIIGLMPAAGIGSGTLTVQVSTDNVTFLTVNTITGPFSEGVWSWRPTGTGAAYLESYRYVRLIASGGLTLSFRQIFLGNMLSSIELESINKDDYFNLPNKKFRSRPTEFWQDIQRDLPVLMLWPSPDFASTFRYIEAQVHQRIEDVGELTNTLDVPDRVLEAVKWGLAAKLAWEDEDFKGDPSAIDAKAAPEIALAFAAITDKGPLKVMPNISGYTR